MMLHPTNRFCAFLFRRRAWLPWVLIAVLIGPMPIPVSFWFEPRSITISDTVEGKSPAIILDRSINRAFYADWSVTVRQAVPREGGMTYVIACNASGATTYRPTAEVPPDATLDWWTQPIKCVQKPGQYVVSSTWTLTVWGYWKKQVSLESSTFRVWEAGALTGHSGRAVPVRL